MVDARSISLNRPPLLVRQRKKGRTCRLRQAKLEGERVDRRKLGPVPRGKLTAAGLPH